MAEAIYMGGQFRRPTESVPSPSYQHGSAHPEIKNIMPERVDTGGVVGTEESIKDYYRGWQDLNQFASEVWSNYGIDVTNPDTLDPTAVEFANTYKKGIANMDAKAAQLQRAKRHEDEMIKQLASGQGRIVGSMQDQFNQGNMDNMLLGGFVSQSTPQAEAFNQGQNKFETQSGYLARQDQREAKANQLGQMYADAQARGNLAEMQQIQNEINALEYADKDIYHAPDKSGSTKDPLEIDVMTNFNQAMISDNPEDWSAFAENLGTATMDADGYIDGNGNKVIRFIDPEGKGTKEYKFSPKMTKAQVANRLTTIYNRSKGTKLQPSDLLGKTNKSKYTSIVPSDDDWYTNQSVPNQSYVRGDQEEAGDFYNVDGSKEPTWYFGSYGTTEEVESKVEDTNKKIRGGVTMSIPSNIARTKGIKQGSQVQEIGYYVDDKTGNASWEVYVNGEPHQMTNREMEEISNTMSAEDHEKVFGKNKQVSASEAPKGNMRTFADQKIGDKMDVTSFNEMANKGTNIQRIKGGDGKEYTAVKNNGVDYWYVKDNNGQFEFIEAR